MLFKQFKNIANAPQVIQNIFENFQNSYNLLYASKAVWKLQNISRSWTQK